MVSSLKNCTKCKLLKPKESFGKSKKKKDGLSCWCRDCYHEQYLKKRDLVLERSRIRYLQNRDQIRLQDKERRNRRKLLNIEQFTEKRRNRHYQDRYGISIEDYDSMFQNQDGKCFICSVPQSDLKRRLAIDHDHSTGVVRELLCSDCNKGLGQFKDDPKLLLKAINYLNR